MCVVSMLARRHGSVVTVMGCACSDLEVIVVRGVGYSVFGACARRGGAAARVADR